MATTLRDIADILGLSTTVVSRVLNDKPGAWASEETRERIKATARAMDYRPSALARALVTGRTMQLAISTADADWQQAHSGRLAEVVGFIQSAAAFHFRVLVLPSPERRADTREFEAIIHSRTCDGFCVYAEQADAPLYGLLRDRNAPFVVVGNPGDPTLPQVDQDNYYYSSSTIRWLGELGHRQIGFAYPAPAIQPFVRELQRGYRDAIIETSGAYDPGMVPERRLSHQQRVSFLTRQQPTAVVVCGAAELLRWRATAAWLHLPVPESLTLLALVEPSELGYLQPGDAYHCHDPATVGARAGELLIQWIQGSPPPDAPILVHPWGPRWYEEQDASWPATK